jgi:DNA-binding NarL/FixJ family response regulator
VTAKQGKVYRLMLIDDHPLVRRGLAELISDEPHLQVCAQASSAEESLQLLAETRPDCLVVDISLPGMSGLELIKRVRSRCPDVRILVTSMHEESLFAERSLRAGANGFISKEEATEKVIEAINRILAGQVYLSGKMTSRLLGTVAGGELGRKSQIESLTDRELEVFGLIGRGLATRDIADKLHLSVKTVETHRDHIRTKLGLETTHQLVRHAVQWVLEQG